MAPHQLFWLQEVSSDEAILPYRGGTDWFDGGKFIAAHQHNFTRVMIWLPPVGIKLPLTYQEPFLP
ncbi:hypothetical protein Q2T40_04755 [Winogradskyella maritima]|nr:hypothetical protein [Winogradskyella maritima]